MYGAQTRLSTAFLSAEFENDVEMYGAQANAQNDTIRIMFENDVEMYGAQAKHNHLSAIKGLRMM